MRLCPTKSTTSTATDSALGEAAAIKYFASLGWSVSLPCRGDSPYDLVADDGDRLYRVQVKTSRSRRFRLQHRCRTGWRDYPAGTVDLFACYSPELDRVEIISAEDAARNVYFDTLPAAR